MTHESAVFLTVAVATTVATAVPGLNVLGVVEISVRRGVRGGAMASLGAATTLFAYLLAIASLTHSLRTLDPRVTVVLHGAASTAMLYFGIRFLRQGLAGNPHSRKSPRAARDGGDFASCAAGAVTCALNPKTLTWSAALVIAALHHLPHDLEYRVGIVAEMALAMFLTLLAWSFATHRYAGSASHARLVRLLLLGAGVLFGAVGAAGLWTFLSGFRSVG